MTMDAIGRKLWAIAEGHIPSQSSFTDRDLISHEAASSTGTGVCEPSRLSTPIAAQVRDYDRAKHFDSKRLDMPDRFAQFAVVAARAAVKDAQLAITDEIALQTATIIGNGAGGMNTLDEFFHKLYGENAASVYPLSIPQWMMNAACGHVSRDLALKGPAFAIASACASGTHAIGQAFQMVRTGQTPIALAGGTEACITVGTIKVGEALRVLSTDTCRPFSKTRTGLVLGEGAAIFVLETRDRALARSAPAFMLSYWALA
jgi:nodulation protein E